MIVHRNIFCAVIQITLGTLIYILLREPVYFTEPIIGSMPNTPLITLPDNMWSYALKFILPDALWCTALLLYASIIEYKALRLVVIILAPSMELGQLAGIVPGTFDPVDLLIYFLLTLIFITQWERTKQKSF